MSTSAPVITSSVTYDSSKWFRTRLNVDNTLSLILIFNYLSFNDSLAVSAAATIRFLKCGLSYITAPSRMAWFLNVILYADKSWWQTQVPYDRTVPISSFAAVGSPISKHVPPLVHHEFETCQTNGKRINPTLPNIDLLQDRVPWSLSFHRRGVSNCNSSLRCLPMTASSFSFSGVLSQPIPHQTLWL